MMKGDKLSDKEVQILTTVYENQWNDIRFKREEDWKVTTAISFFVPFVVGIAEFLNSASTSPVNNLSLQSKFGLAAFIAAMCITSFLLVRRHHQIWRMQTETITKIEEAFGLYDVLSLIEKPILGEYHRHYGHRKEMFGEGKSTYYVCMTVYIILLGVIGILTILLM